MTSPVLTDRQRAPLPFTRGPRRGNPSGGATPAVRPLTLVPELSGRLRDPGLNDATTFHDRGPWYHRSYAIPAGQSWVSWTDAGPDRPSLHMSQQSHRRWSGTSASRFPYLPESPTGGMHTETPHAVPRTLARYLATQQMMPPRQDRLASGQYRGQSYSATTRALR